MTEQIPEPTITGGEVTAVPEKTEEQILVEYTAALAEVDRQLAIERERLSAVERNLTDWISEQARQLDLVVRYEAQQASFREEVQSRLARVVVQSTQPEDQPDAPVVK